MGLQITPTRGWPLAYSPTEKRPRRAADELLGDREGVGRRQMRGQTFEAEPLQRPCGRKEATYYGPASETGRSLDPLQTEGSITVPHPRPNKELRMCSILIEHRSSWLAASQAGIIHGASSFPEVSKPLGEKSEKPLLCPQSPGCRQLS